MFPSSNLGELKLLLVEDDEDDYVITRDLLDDLVAGQYELDWARNAAEAREQLSRQVHHVVLVDYNLGAEDGLTLLAEAPRLGFYGPIIMLTGQDNRELDLGALRAGAVDYLVKSQLTSQSLARAIRYAVARSEMASERAERHRAEAENRAKSEFLAHLSHELRTPLAAILGYTDLMLSSDPDVQTRSQLEIVKRNGCHLLGLLNDVLDLSKIEAGKLEIDVQEIDLNELLADIQSLLSSAASDKSLGLSFRGEGDVPTTIRTDSLRVRQILINLISNAIRFTDEGSVEVVVAAEPDPMAATATDGGSEVRGLGAAHPVDGEFRESHRSDAAPTPRAGRYRLRIEVRDTGIGISDHDRKRLFRPFVQVGSDRSAHREGTGLGLAISRQLARRLGGDIVIGARPEPGSVFIVTIDPGDLDSSRFAPLSLERTSGTYPDRRISLSGRVLVADDLTDIRQLIGYMIRRTGASVDLAKDGQDAVEQVERAQAAGQPFDVIIMDVQMPRVDGLAATRTLRAGGFDRPILALTAATMSGERERCLAAGCTEHLSKPIDESLLLKTLQGFLPSTAPSRSGTSPVSGSTVLLVEDDPDARNATSRILRLLGWHVLEAGSGEQALAAVSTVATPPMLALVDLTLPDMDGYELIDRLRGVGCTGTRCVSLSGRAADPDRAREVGADHHLLKPIGLDHLRAFTRDLGYVDGPGSSAARATYAGDHQNATRP